MNQAVHQQIVSLIWGVADDVLRDLYNRGKYRDVILPMTVLRRLDAVLEPTKQAVLQLKKTLDDAGIVNQEQALRDAARQDFYNTSEFRLRDLTTATGQTKLRQNFEAYLDGFSENVQEIINNFDFRHQVPKLVAADALALLIEKFLDPRIDLSPAGLDNHGMGSVFEDLVRRFNEANNEEAGEHWTPRDVIRLMTRLMFEPIADRIPAGTYTLYDGAMGTGGMLTVAQDTLTRIARGKRIDTHLYGQEINAETYAIAKADLILTGQGRAADNIKGGPEYSTLSNDAFSHMTFDFMLSNPPYGKSWKTDLERMGGKKGLSDSRFIVEHDGEPEFSLVTRTSDGQMLFMANLLAKMKNDTPLGSRIAEIHNGSSLFTGDAGQGESNARRYLIENDWLEAIVALPLKLFYNTGIATYVWVVSNRKEERRKGKVQLIDATGWSVPLRKNLGQKSVELSEPDIERVLAAYDAFDEADPAVSKVFNNRDFGYYKIVVEQPLRHADGGIIRDGRGRPKADPALRDSEQVPLNEPGEIDGDGISAFMAREVLPFAPDAWVDRTKTKIGYEISFTRHFYKPAPLRTLDEIRADIRALEAETEDLVREIAEGDA